MAANKFATMLHRKTNKLTLILVYALLEWVLILLLLLNALFSYLILKFADYFGLKRPCLWCSRVDHVLDPQNSSNSYRNFICDSHALEISKLGYCSNHRKLAESQHMCEDCSSSSSWRRDDSQKAPKKITFMIRDGDEKETIVNGEAKDLKCSCCEVSLETMKGGSFYSPYFLIKPGWGVLDYTQKGNLIAEDETREGAASERSRSDFGIDHGEICSRNDALLSVESVSGSDCDEKGVSKSRGDGVERKPTKEKPLIDVSMEDPPPGDGEDASFEILQQHLEFYIDSDHDFRLIPVGLIDSTTAEKGDALPKLLEEDEVICDDQEGFLGCELQKEEEHGVVLGDGCKLGEAVAEASVSAGENEGEKEEEKVQIPVPESEELGETQNPPIMSVEGGDLIMEVCKEVAAPQATQGFSKDDDFDVQARGAPAVDAEINMKVHPASEEVFEFGVKETEAVMSIGAEIPLQECTAEVPNRDISGQECITEAHTGDTSGQECIAEVHNGDTSRLKCNAELQAQDVLPSRKCNQDDPSTSSSKLCADDDHGSKLVEEEVAESESMMANGHTSNNRSRMSPDPHKVEEEKMSDTPVTVDLPKKMVLPERNEWGAEESLDGSVISEFEASEGVLTVESLKSALKVEKKALNALYVELEEERSASAIAANETMAMINRLQEEKAAMQMEALQYQRMMEEQSEYDQEALQLLNELMVKREREKQELEKELEIYRKKVIDYEAKEKMMMLRRRRDGSARSRTSTASCSNAEDSDGLSIDLNQEGKEEDSSDCHHESGAHNTPVDTVLSLDESLANFEDERLSILEQLKILEEKLFSLADEEERHFEDMKPFEQFCEENGKEFEEHFNHNSEQNGVASGSPQETNGKRHQESRTVGSKAKRLLPLFDAISAEAEDGVINGNEQEFDNCVSQPFPMTKFELETKKLAIEEEVDHLYERLHALEADREFLKHCVGSLKKGDKGLDLLHEILQHLRDLKNVELRVRNVGDGPLA